MKDAVWVFRTFGFQAGVRFVLNTLERKYRKLTEPKKRPVRFEDLSDEEARQTLLAAGISGWHMNDRNSLNKAWNDSIDLEYLN